MGCGQSKPNDVNCARVGVDRPGKSTVANNSSNSTTLAKTHGVQGKQENDDGLHPNDWKGSANDQSGSNHHPSSSGSLSDALDLASLRKEMKSQGDIAKTVVRIEVRQNNANKVPSWLLALCMLFLSLCTSHTGSIWYTYRKNLRGSHKRTHPWIRSFGRRATMCTSSNWHRICRQVSRFGDR